jgi:hypothetical protein
VELVSDFCFLTSETLFVIVEREWSDRLKAGHGSAGLLW